MIAKDNGADSDYLICPLVTKPLLMPDNRVGICTFCGEAIQHRPHVPTQPKKMCIPCFLDGEAGKKPTVVVTQKTAEEVRAIAKKQAH